MKIALTGPHCSGKSTVFKEVEKNSQLRESFRFVHYSGEKAPIDYDNVEKLRQNPRLEIDLSFWMICDLIKREVEFEQEPLPMVLDRCVIDQLVYPQVILKSQSPREISDFVKQWIISRPYEKVFLFPANQELLKRYGKKEKDPSFVMEIENRYRKVLQSFEIKHEILPLEQSKQIKTISRYLEEII